MQLTVSTRFRSRVALCAALLLCALPAPVFAGPELTAEGGVLAHASMVDVGVGNETFHVGVSPGGTYAIGAGWDFGPHLALELRWQEIFAGLDPDGLRPSTTDLDITALTLGPRYTFLDPGDPVRPWLAAGLGWYHGVGEIRFADVFRAADGESFDLVLQQHGDALGFEVGGGVDFPIRPWISVTLGVRYHNAGEIDALTPLAGIRLVWPSDEAP